METVLIILFIACFSYIAWWNRAWVIALCLVLLPTYLLRFQAWFVPMTVLEVMVLVIVMVWGLKQIQKSKIKNQKVGIWLPWRWPVLLFVLAGVVAVIISPDTRQALGLWKAYILEPVLFFFVFVNTIRTRQQVRTIVWALGAVVVLVGYVALLQSAGLVAIPGGYGFEHPPRATSFFPFPTAVGKLVGPLLAFFIGWWLVRADLTFRPAWDFIRRNIFALGVIMFGLLALGFSFSRGALIGVFCSIVFVSFFSRWKRALWLGLLVVIIASFALPYTREKIISVVDVRDTSADVHVVMWKGAMRIIKANPITGTGLASFPVVYEQYKEASHTEYFPNPDQLILTLWIEMGLAGMVIFIWLVVRFFSTGINALRRSTDDLEARALTVGLLAAMVALLVHGMVDTPYFKNDLAIAFWTMAGIVVVMGHLPSEAPKR